MTKFQRQNEHLDETMKSHLIDDLTDYGVWDDDYERFLSCRAQRLIKEIELRLHPNL